MFLMDFMQDSLPTFYQCIINNYIVVYNLIVTNNPKLNSTAKMSRF